MVLNGETARGDTTWADRTATQLLSARRKRNGGDVVFRAAESGKASNAKRRATKLGEGKRKPTVRGGT